MRRYAIAFSLLAVCGLVASALAQNIVGSPGPGAGLGAIGSAMLGTATGSAVTDFLCGSLLRIASAAREEKPQRPAPVAAHAPAPVPGRIKTVQVSIIQNPSLWRVEPVVGLEEQLTREIVDRIQAATPWKVVQSGADTELVAMIRSFTLANAVLNQLNEWRWVNATMAVEVCWRDLRTGEMLSKPAPPQVNPLAMAAGLPNPRTPISTDEKGRLPGGLPGVFVRSSASFCPERGQSITSAQQQCGKSMGAQIISLMEKDW